MNEFNSFVKEVKFLSDNEKENIINLLTSAVNITKDSDLDTALRDWARIATGIAWFSSQAARLVEEKSKQKDARQNELLITSRSTGKDPQWVANAQACTDPKFLELSEELSSLRMWYDFLAKMYAIVMNQQKILDQLSNNQRAQARLDVAQ